MVTPRREALAAAQPTAPTHIRPPRHTGTVYDDLTIETWVHGADPRSRRQSAEGTSVTCRWGRHHVYGSLACGEMNLSERGARGRRRCAREILAVVGVEPLRVRVEDLGARLGTQPGSVAGGRRGQHGGGGRLTPRPLW